MNTVEAPQLNIGPETPVQICPLTDEFEQVLDLYRAAAPKRVLEIGTAAGGTLYHWLRHATKGATVVTVDFPEPAYTLDRDLCRTWRPPGVGLQMISGDSHDSRTVAEVREHGPYDWVFIDGDHRYEQCATDVSLYWPMLTQDGHLLLHDIALDVGYEDGSAAGVRRVWDEIRQGGYWTREIRVLPPIREYGIGVVKGPL